MALGGNLFRLRTAPGEGIYCALTFTVPAGGVTAGDMVQVGNVYGVVVSDGDAADTDGVLVYKAERVMAPCLATTANFTVGEKVYLDTSTGLVVDTTNSNTVLIGICTQASTLADTQVEIHLDGMLNITS